jgi:hypothetical protein
MLCFKLYFDIEKIKCFALSSQELTENTDNLHGLEKILMSSMGNRASLTSSQWLLV